MTSTTDAQAAGIEKQYQVPEWEHNVASQGDKINESGNSTKATFANKFDSILPPYKRYVGLSRKIFLWVLLGIFLALLVLIIGLAVGLSPKSR
jgi:hypothetical protein